MRPRVRQVLGGLLRLTILSLLLPLLLIDLILIQTELPLKFIDWRPFAIAATIWAAFFSLIAYRYQSRKPLIWGGISLVFAAIFICGSRHFAVTVAVVILTDIPLLIAFACLAGALNFLYRNRYSEPLLILLPTCAIAWSFIVLLYQPCLVAWATWVTGKQDVLEVLLSVFGNVSTNAVMLAVVVLPTMVMYMLGKHVYVDAYGWARNKLINKTN